MMAAVESLGRVGITFCENVGRSGLFLLATIFRKPKWQQAWGLLSVQLYRVGVLSLVIILLSALFIGMVVALQGYNTLEKFYIYFFIVKL